jgi:hypothetical protein
MKERTQPVDRKKSQRKRVQMLQKRGELEKVISAIPIAKL